MLTDEETPEIESEAARYAQKRAVGPGGAEDRAARPRLGLRRDA